MLPVLLSKQLKKGIGDYIETTFPMTNEKITVNNPRLNDWPMVLTVDNDADVFDHDLNKGIAFQKIFCTHQGFIFTYYHTRNIIQYYCINEVIQ